MKTCTHYIDTHGQHYLPAAILQSGERLGRFLFTGGLERAQRSSLVYVTIFARSPGGGWFQDTKKPGLADTKTGQKLTGKGTPGHENNYSRLRTDNL